MARTYKKRKIDKIIYHLYENENEAILINTNKIHKPDYKYLEKRYAYYVYDKRKHDFSKFKVEDYAYSYDYEWYELMPTLREAKHNAELHFNS